MQTHPTGFSDLLHGHHEAQRCSGWNRENGNGHHEQQKPRGERIPEGSKNLLQKKLKQTITHEEYAHKLKCLLAFPSGQDSNSVGEVRYRQSAELGALSAAGASPVSGQSVLGDLRGDVAVASGNFEQLRPAASTRHRVWNTQAAAGGAQGKSATEADVQRGAFCLSGEKNLTYRFLCSKCASWSPSTSRTSTRWIRPGLSYLNSAQTRECPSERSTQPQTCCTPNSRRTSSRELRLWMRPSPNPLRCGAVVHRVFLLFLAIFYSISLLWYKKV